MNKRFHPALLYLALLLLVMLVSWIGSIIELRQGRMTINSVIGAQGIRWLVRNAAAVMSAAPIGNALMIMLMVGIGKGSGFVRAISAPKALSPKERSALFVSLALFAVILLVILWGIFGSSHLLLGVTGTLAGSPLSSGIVFILMLLFVLPAMVYGFSSDTLRGATSAFIAFLHVAIPTAGFLLTMLIAAQLLETFKYSNLNVLLGMSNGCMKFVEFVVYWLPLPFFLVRK